MLEVTLNEYRVVLLSILHKNMPGPSPKALGRPSTGDPGAGAPQAGGPGAGAPVERPAQDAGEAEDQGQEMVEEEEKTLFCI